MAQIVSLKKVETPTDFGRKSIMPATCINLNKIENGDCNMTLEKTNNVDSTLNSNETNNGECTINVDTSSSSQSPDPYISGMHRSSSKGIESPQNMQWKNINFMTKKGDLILKDLSGALYSGEMTAIMGPSGAGKSTLINVLTGFMQQNVTGQILVNGTPRDMRVFRKHMCYIMQDDYILPQLTVKETVFIAASLQLPSTMSKEDKQKAVDKCLLSLGLTSFENQRAGELSGGQRKRLCVAQDLISNPTFIFLDEPTSGLDSSACSQCLQLLQSLAKEGRTVVCSIHQPSSKFFEMFDKLYMLADGYCIYKGPTQNLVRFLADQGLNCPQYYNPADYVTEVATGAYGDWNVKLKNVINTLDDANENSLHVDQHNAITRKELTPYTSTTSLVQKNCSNEKERSPKSKQKDYATSFFNQFRVLLYRCFICTIREPMNIQTKLIGNLSFSLLMGTIFYKLGDDASSVHNIAGFVFCAISFSFVTCETPASLIFSTQRTIYHREHMNSWYDVKTFYLAMTMAEIPFEFLFPMTSGSIIYWMSGQPSDISRFCLFVLSMILVALVSQAVGELVGSLFDFQNAIFVSTCIAIVQCLFCGFFVSTEQMAWYVKWIPYITFCRYGFQTAMLCLYSMDRPFLQCNKTFCPHQDPKVIMEELGIEGSFYEYFSILLAFLLFFKIMTFLVLKFKVMKIK